MKQTAWLLAGVLLVRPALAQNPLQGTGGQGDDTTGTVTVDPLSGDSIFDTNDRSGAEQAGTCTGVWASWRGVRNHGPKALYLELVIRWGSNTADVPAEVDSVALLGHTGHVQPVHVGWVSEPRFVLRTEYTPDEWLQSTALDVPFAMADFLAEAPIVVGLSGRSARSTYSCRARLPREVPGDLARLRRQRGL